MIPFVLIALQGAAHYKVTLEGGVEGTARCTVTRRPEGGKTVRFVIDLRRGNATLELRNDSTFDANGAPVRLSQVTGLPGKSPQHETIVTFDAAGANAVVRDLGVPKASHVSLAPKLSRANAAQKWFVDVRPKLGEVARAWTFDPDTLEWIVTETTYVGPTKGGHLLRVVQRDKPSTQIVDDAGVPVRIEQGETRLEKSDR